jgi:SAM-dependent methyltransferase
MLLAPKQIPPEYKAWNQQWHAPHGRPIRRMGRLTRMSQQELRQRHPRWTGPFGFQPNSSTRRFEYPWAFHCVDLASGTQAVEIGGGLSGFQFVLSKSGVAVTNVDPGEAATGRGWPVDAQSIARLNRAFGTYVHLENRTLQEAQLGDESADVVYSISTIEHIPQGEIPSLMRDVRRVLRPGGRFVLTVDLFLNVEPFGARSQNEFGTNISACELAEQSGLELEVGNRAELLGFPEFDPRRILARLDEFLIGEYPALAQCLVLRKPSA